MAKVTRRTLDMITAEAKAIASPLGLTVHGVEYLREDGIWYLRVTVSHPDGTAITHCESLHRPLSKRLDELDPITDSYYLEVTSLGSSSASEQSAQSSVAPPPEEV